MHLNMWTWSILTEHQNGAERWFKVIGATQACLSISETEDLLEFSPTTISRVPDILEGFQMLHRGVQQTDWFESSSHGRPPLCFSSYNSLINALHPKITPLQHEIELNHLDVISNWLNASKRRRSIINNSREGFFFLRLVQQFHLISCLFGI